MSEQRMRTICIFLIFTGALCAIGCGGEPEKELKENTLEYCSDEIDNDGNGQMDCEESSCQSFIMCAGATETTVAVCTDNIDNDGDGHIDCEDDDCRGFVFCEEITAQSCSDGVDNDSDGAIDCEDEGCSFFLFCPEKENTPEACENSIDDDNDGLVDCDDVDCNVFCDNYSTAETTSVSCKDRVDNDNDGLIDCDDEDCEGFVFCLETTSAVCRDGVDNDSDGYTDCDDTDCHGFVFCPHSFQESTFADCTDDEDNDNDGDPDCLDKDCWHWPICRIYNGGPLVDSWEETWDGIQRAPQTWAKAQDICHSLGARLPTATEIFRVRADENGSGEVGSPYNTTYLWTRIADYRESHRVVLRLSDGAVDYYDENDAHAFRCVWPNQDHASFSDDACFGPPNAECHSFNIRFNTDKYDRPAMNFAAAVNECMFYNASLPTMVEFGGLVQSGWENPSNNWLWMAESKYWYRGHYGLALGRWNTEPQPWWGYDNGTDGSLSLHNSNQRFRCVGKRSESEGYLPSSPACMNNDCFIANQRKSTLIADNADRRAATYSQALTNCVNLGGTLPRSGEFTDLIHAGWERGVNNDTYLWSSEAVYWHENRYGYSSFRWAGEGSERWAISNETMAVRLPSSVLPYRCVWREKFSAEPVRCESYEMQVLSSEDTFECVAATDGSSDGNATNNREANDGWGNAWDYEVRRETKYDDAANICSSIGARLPTATELYRIRNNQPIYGLDMDMPNSEVWLWTIVPSHQADRNVIIRLSDGATSSENISQPVAYRCIWPTTLGDVFGGRSCFAHPDNSCQQSGSLRWDRYDRPAMNAPSAVWECNYYGGFLPNQDDMSRLIRSGAENGTNNMLWINRPIHRYRSRGNRRGYAVAQWTDIGSENWVYERGSGSYALEQDLRHFRCAYSDSAF